MDEQENKKLSGIQKAFLRLALSAFYGMVSGYESLTEDQKKEIHIRIANRMFDKAASGKLDVPYDDWEKDYIKEGLKLEK